MSLGGAEHSICAGLHQHKGPPFLQVTSMGSHIEQNCVSKEKRREGLSQEVGVGQSIGGCVGGDSKAN